MHVCVYIYILSSDHISYVPTINNILCMQICYGRHPSICGMHMARLYQARCKVMSTVLVLFYWNWISEVNRSRNPICHLKVSKIHLTQLIMLCTVSVQEVAVCVTCIIGVDHLIKPPKGFCCSCHFISMMHGFLFLFFRESVCDKPFLCSVTVKRLVVKNMKWEMWNLNLCPPAQILNIIVSLNSVSFWANVPSSICSSIEFFFKKMFLNLFYVVCVASCCKRMCMPSASQDD